MVAGTLVLALVIVTVLGRTRLLLLSRIVASVLVLVLMVRWTRPLVLVTVLVLDTRVILVTNVPLLLVILFAKPR